MKTLILLGWITGWVLGLPAGVRAAAPAEPVAPQVVVTHPRDGDQQVDPLGREIAIEFDQGMEPAGYSFTLGGGVFPKVTGKPGWRTARECVLPVQLEPGRAYAVGINSATSRNFKSVAGVPAAPIVLTFRTRAAGAGAPGATASGAEHVEAARQLRQALTLRYAYRDVHVVDWAGAWRQFEPRLLAASSRREFALIAGQMLAGTQDVHIWLVEGGEVVPAFRREVRPNVNPRLLPGLVAGWTQPHPMLAVGRAAAGMGYLAIHSWEKKHAPQLLDATFAALRELQKLPALVIDVRLNTGGDERLARQLAGCFVRQRVR